jgi:hypothetical protein
MKTPISSGFKFKAAELGIFETEHANTVLKNFAPGCRIMGLTRGCFSLIDLIYNVLKHTGPADVAIVTWSAGIKDVNNVKWMVDSHLIKSVKLITDHSYKTRQAKYAASIEDIFGLENIRTSEIHAKFVLIRNEKFSVTIRTSMNLNANKTCESFELDESEEIYNFYNDFVVFVSENQRPGFVADSAVVNKTADLFFNTTTTSTGWSDL